MFQVPEALENATTYYFYVPNYQSLETSCKEITERSRREHPSHSEPRKYDEDWDDENIVKIFMTDRIYFMHVD